MMHKTVRELVESIAKEQNYKYFENLISEDPPIFDMIVANEKNELSMAVHEKDGQLFAYELTSNHLPREIYADSFRNGFDYQSRSDEVMSNFEGILTKKTRFTPNKSIFNVRRGYIKIPIHGVVRNIWLKDNYFDLPITGEVDESNLHNK